MYSLTFTAQTPAELRQQVRDWMNTPTEGLPPAAQTAGSSFPSTPQPPVASPSIPAPAAYVPSTQPAAAQPTPAAPMAPSTMSAVPTAPMAAASGIPTSAPSYTQADLMAAGARLMTTVGMPAMQQLLARFQVQAIHQLPPEQYGMFAQAMREMGAQI